MPKADKKTDESPQSCTARDGTVVATSVWSNEAPRAVVIVAGAMGAYRSFYRNFATWLAEAGYAVMTFDYRGMLDSNAAVHRDVRDSTTIRDWAYDAEAVIADARLRFPNLPIVWLGHSVGAQIYGLIPNHHLTTGLLSIAAGSGYWRINAKPLRYYVLAVWHILMPLALWSRGKIGGTFGHMLSTLPPKVAHAWRHFCLQPRYFGADPNFRAQLRSCDRPIVALSIVDDEMMSRESTEALFAEYPNAKVSIVDVQPGDFGHKIGHFGLFRTRSGEARLWQFVAQQIASLSAPKNS